MFLLSESIVYHEKNENHDFQLKPKMFFFYSMPFARITFLQLIATSGFLYYFKRKYLFFLFDNQLKFNISFLLCAKLFDLLLFCISSSVKFELKSSPPELELPR